MSNNHWLQLLPLDKQLRASSVSMNLQPTLIKYTHGSGGTVKQQQQLFYLPWTLRASAAPAPRTERAQCGLWPGTDEQTRTQGRGVTWRPAVAAARQTYFYLHSVSGSRFSALRNTRADMPIWRLSLALSFYTLKTTMQNRMLLETWINIFRINYFMLVKLWVVFPYFR